MEWIEIHRLQKKINNIERKIAELSGKEKQLLEQLENTAGTKDISIAKKKMQQMRNNIQTAERKIERMKNKIRQEYLL